MIHRSSALKASHVVPQANNTPGNKRASSCGHGSPPVSATRIFVTLSSLPYSPKDPFSRSSPRLPSNLSIPAFASSRVHHELASSHSPKMPCRMLRVPDFVDPPETYRPFQTHDKDEEVLYVWANGENYVVAHADLSVIWDEWGQVPYLHTDFFSALPSRKSSPVYSPSTPTSSLSASDSFNPQWLSASPDQESGGEMKDLPESLVAALTKLRLASSDGMIPFSEVALRQLVTAVCST